MVCYFCTLGERGGTNNYKLQQEETATISQKPSNTIPNIYQPSTPYPSNAPHSSQQYIHKNDYTNDYHTNNYTYLYQERTTQ